jgi:hypothetical protein
LNEILVTIGFWGFLAAVVFLLIGLVEIKKTVQPFSLSESFERFGIPPVIQAILVSAALFGLIFLLGLYL